MPDRTPFPVSTGALPVGSLAGRADRRADSSGDTKQQEQSSRMPGPGGDSAGMWSESGCRRMPGPSLIVSLRRGTRRAEGSGSRERFEADPTTKETTLMTTNTINTRIRLGGTVLLAWTFLAQAAWAQGGPIRIVVLPFYTEAGADVTDGGYEGRHYRRLSRYINNQLVRHGFEVINPSAHEYTEEEYNRLRERPREDSPLAAMELTRKFLVDAVYLVWLDVNTRTTDDGLCKAKARVEGEGYDSGARDLGPDWTEPFNVTRKEWRRRDRRGGEARGGRGRAAPHRLGRATESESHHDQRRLDRRHQREVERRRRDRAKHRGARESHQCSPGGSNALRARGGVRKGAQHRAGGGRGEDLPDGDPAREPAGELRGVAGTHREYRSLPLSGQRHDDAAEHRRCGREIVLKGVPHRYTPAEVDLLTGIRPGNSTSRSIVFVVDRDRAQAIEFSGRDNARKTREPVVAASEIAKGLTTVVSSDAHYQDKAYIDIPIYFDYDSDQVSERSRAQVGEVARALRTQALRRARIRIEGHTDERGLEQVQPGPLAAPGREREADAGRDVRHRRRAPGDGGFRRVAARGSGSRRGRLGGEPPRHVCEFGVLTGGGDLAGRRRNAASHSRAPWPSERR